MNDVSTTDGRNIQHLLDCPGCGECDHLLEFYGSCDRCLEIGHKSTMTAVESGHLWCENCARSKGRTSVADRHYAVLLPHSPRFQDWIEVFGEDSVEIESPYPEPGIADDGNSGPWLKAKVSSLDEEQMGRLVPFLASHWNLPISKVIEDLNGAIGLPIDARDVVVLTEEW